MRQKLAKKIKRTIRQEVAQYLADYVKVAKFRDRLYFAWRILTKQY